MKLQFSFVQLQISAEYESKQEKLMALIEPSISLLFVIFALLIDSCFDYKCQLLWANDGNQVIER